MKTTIDIPDKLLKDVIKLNGAKTKKDAIIQALSDYVQRRKMQGLTKLSGTFKDFMNEEDLKKMREDDYWEKIPKFQK